MSSRVSTSSLLLFTLLLIVAQPAHSDIVRDTCKKCADSSKNVNFDFCVRSLGSDPRSRGADLRGLGSITLDLLQGQVKSTSKYIGQISSRKWDKDTKQCLSDCAELYEDSSSTMEDVVPAYKAGRYDDVQTWVSAVLDNEDTCESGFSERAVASPLTKQNGDTLQLSAIALGIVHFVKTGS